MIQTIFEISKQCNASFISQGHDTVIDEIITDSRKLSGKNVACQLFVAIDGLRHDAHQYIPELYKQGVRNFLVEKDVTPMEGANILRVESSLNSLQKIAALYRQKFRMPVVAITGSNGKTIVKEWLFQLLKNDFRIVRSPGSYNSQLGVALSLLLLEQEYNVALIEAGVSKPGEMERLQAMIKPDMVILTHFGSAHDEGFESREAKLDEKLKLAIGADVLIYGKDDDLVEEKVKTFTEHNYIKTISWSRTKHATVQVVKEEKLQQSTQLWLVYKSSSIQLELPFTDLASVENALSCLCALLAVERLDEAHLKTFMQLQPLAMRMEMKQGINGCIVINDSYSSDLHSLETALEFLDQQNPRLSKTLILSDILESGLAADKLYKKVADKLSGSDIQKFIGIGSEIKEVLNHFQFPEQHIYENTDAFIADTDTSRITDEIILVKGARRFEFDRITRLLEQRVHQTVMEINLDAVVHNLNVYKSKLKPGTKLMAMVKAFSYGSGSYELAKLLQHQRVDYLSVAYADEGADLRRAGITLPIMVMNPEPGSFRQIIDFNLEPELYSFEVLNEYIQEANSKKYHNSNPPAIHIEFDTGMHRLGFAPEDVDHLLATLLQYPHIRIASVFSHLAASDEPAFDNFTRKQVELFDHITKQLSAALPQPFLRHLANSAGITRFPEATFDMVRLGLGLQGIDPAGFIQNELIPVARLKSVISQVKKVKKGESIGYSRKTIADHDFNMGIVAIGYADGLNRLLSNRKGKVYINGAYADIVGNVCMDMCMVDLTDIEACPGDQVYIFHDAASLMRMSEACQTIPYETLTSVSGRVKRIYYKE